MGILILLALVICCPDSKTRVHADSIKITYVGNEGFIIDAGESKVLVDALYGSGVAGYVPNSPSRRRKLEKGMPPFDHIDVALATHYHADHFDPSVVGMHLANNRSTSFVSTRQAVEQLEDEFEGSKLIRDRVIGVLPAEGRRDTMVFDGITVVAVNLHHGRSRPVDNLGFIIDIGGIRLFHVGDTEVTPEELAALNLDTLGIDVFMLPYWFLAYSEWDGYLESRIGASVLVPMHIPPPSDPKGYLADIGGYDGMKERILAKYSTAVFFESEMTSMWVSPPAP